jgi:hypothetical protein
MGRDHEPPSDRVGDHGAEILADEVETEIDPGGNSRGGENGPLVDVENARIDRDTRESRRQRRGVHPMRGRYLPVQQARCGKNESPRTDRHHTGAPLVGVRQRQRDGGWNRSVEVIDPGTTMVSARRSGASPFSTKIENPLDVLTFPGLTAHRVTEYRLAPR